MLYGFKPIVETSRKAGKEVIVRSNLTIYFEKGFTDIPEYCAGHQLLVSWSWAVKGTTLHDIIGPQGFIQFGPGNFTVPPEEKGRYQYCTFTDRSGQQTLIQSSAKPDMYTLQAEHFLACIRGEATCQTPGTEAIKAVAVAEAVLQAGRAGKTVEIGL